MTDVIPGSVGAEAPTVPGSPGAVTMEQAYADAGAEVHPRDAVPPAEDTASSGAPAEAPDDANAEGARIAEWKKSLAPENQKMVDRIITEARQKDSETLTSLNEKVQRLAWAEQLNQLVASENPADRQRAEVLLESTLNTLRKFAPQPEPDPVARADAAANEIEAISPEAAAELRAQARELQTLKQQLGKVVGTLEGSEAERADATLDQELKFLVEFAKTNNMPYVEAEVLATAKRLDIADMQAAYWATYGPKSFERGKQAAFQSLQNKQRAALPGGSPSPGAPQRPKSTDIMDHWNHAKSELGVSGSVFDK